LYTKQSITLTELSFEFEKATSYQDRELDKLSGKGGTQYMCIQVIKGHYMPFWENHAKTMISSQY
jgi:hypothetical protein